MLLRDLFPEGAHPKFHHAMDITKDLAAAFVTGFIFYWIVDYFQKARRDYARRIDLELNVVAILSWYRDFVMIMLYGQPRVEFEGNVFVPWKWNEIPEVVGLMVAIRPDAKVVELYEDVDPFAKHFRSTDGFLQATANKILELGIDVPEELRPYLPWRDTVVPVSVRPIDEWREITRIDALESLLRQVNVYYRFLQRMVFDHTNITPQVNAIYERGSYRSVWDGVDEHTRFRMEQRKKYPIIEIPRAESSMPEDLTP